MIFTKEPEIKVRPFFTRCIIVESVTVAIILLTVFVITLTSKSFTKKIKKWYIKNVLDNTSVNEVIKENFKYEI